MTDCAVLSRVVSCSAVQCSAVQCSVSALLCSALLFSALRVVALRLVFSVRHATLRLYCIFLSRLLFKFLFFYSIALSFLISS